MGPRHERLGETPDAMVPEAAAITALHILRQPFGRIQPLPFPPRRANAAYAGTASYRRRGMNAASVNPLRVERLGENPSHHAPHSLPVGTGRSQRAEPAFPVRLPDRLDQRSRGIARVFQPARLRLLPRPGPSSRESLARNRRAQKGPAGQSLRTIFRGLRRRDVAVRSGVIAAQKACCVSPNSAAHARPPRGVKGGVF